MTLAVEPCDPNADRVGVVVTDTRRLQAVERSVSLADLPPAARPRALALAVAELLRAAEQPRAATPHQPSPEPEPTPAAANEAVRVAAGADALLRIYPTRQTMLLGAQLSLGVSGRRWHTALALDGALGQPSVDLGAVSVRMLGGAITAGPRFSVGHATFDVGASASAGWAWVRGEPGGAGVAARAGNGFVAAAGARFAVQAPGSAGWRFHVAAEAARCCTVWTRTSTAAPPPASRAPTGRSQSASARHKNARVRGASAQRRGCRPASQPCAM